MLDYEAVTLKISRDLNLIAPKLKTMAIAAVAECNQAGFPIQVFEAWRSQNRQEELYSQGRTKPGKVVTKAPKGFSLHNWGLAVDIAYNIAGKWSWEGDFDRVTSIFISHGFEPPPSFERVHFQVSGGLSIGEIRLIAQNSGVQGLWLALGLT